MDEDKFELLLGNVREIGRRKHFLDTLAISLSESDFKDYLDLYRYP